MLSLPVSVALPLQPYVLLCSHNLRVALVVLISAMSSAQTASPSSPSLDAVASDPVALGWMVGSPPPPDKLIRFSDGSFRQFPQTRWAFSNLRQLVATRAIPRGDGPILPLRRAERA